jgi:Zn-finger nucleic acid-binding protein
VLCPNEKTELQPVTVESHYGQTVVLDQCPDCGGIWFDNFELFRARQGEAKRIEQLNVDCLRAPISIEQTELRCPRDNARLVQFSDYLFPKDLILARCPLCNGFWLNRGEFVKYQRYRQKRQDANKPKEILVEDNPVDREIIKAFEENRTSDSSLLLGRLAKFLSTPLDASGHPQSPDQLSEKENNALSLIMTALTLVLRFLIRI